MVPYGALQGLIGPYGALCGLLGPYGGLRVLMRPYGALCGFIVPYSALWGCFTKLNKAVCCLLSGVELDAADRALQGLHIRPYKAL